jgi:dolichyl-phosphate-mannose-protein mannosyltransferase
LASTATASSQHTVRPGWECAPQGFDRRDLLGLAAALLAGGLLKAAFLLRAPVFLIADSENYFLPGFQLARGLGFDLEARRTPLYPAFIAAVINGIGQDLAGLALAQHLLGLLTVALTYGLGRALFGRLAGLLAALSVALNGSLLISEQTITTETLFMSLLTLAALLGVLALRGGPLWLYPLGGLLLGLAALARPVGLGLLPGLPLALLFQRPTLRTWLLRCALYGIGVALVLLPWMIRNYLTIRVFSTEGAFGQTLVGRTVRHDGFIFVERGAAPDPDNARQRARELMQDAANHQSFITPLRRRLMQEQGLTELQANQLMRDLAVEAVLRQPGYYLQGTARFFFDLAAGWPDRLRDAWQSRRDPDARDEWESHPEIAPLLGPPSEIQERQFGAADRLASLFQPGRFGPPLLALAGLGTLAAVVGDRRRRAALLPALWAAGLLLVGVALVGPVLRYRYPAEPFLAVLAAGGLVVGAAWLQRLRPRFAQLRRLRR